MVLLIFEIATFQWVCIIVLRSVQWVKDIGSPQSIQRSLRSNKIWSYSHYMYKPAARSSCSFKTMQIATWLLHSIVPFHPLRKALEKKCTFFQFACQSSYFQPNKLYISEISNQYSIYWAYKKCIFLKFKNRTGMPADKHPRGNVPFLLLSLATVSHFPMQSLLRNLMVFVFIVLFFKLEVQLNLWRLHGIGCVCLSSGFLMIFVKHLLGLLRDNIISGLHMHLCFCWSFWFDSFCCLSIDCIEQMFCSETNQ